MNIKEFWDERGKTFGADPRATLADMNLKMLEIEAITKYVKGNVLDAGCGNGFTTVSLAPFVENIVGIDFSPVLIKQAQLTYDEVVFQVADLLKLPFGEATFDTVFTERTIININPWSEQQKAIKEIYRVLKKGGRFIMVEQTQEGLAQVNRWRKLLGLSIIKNWPNNLYLSEQQLNVFLPKLFTIEKIEHFASTYYFFSKVIHQFLIKNPSYDGMINRIGAALPNIGKFGYCKLYLLKKI